MPWQNLCGATTMDAKVDARFYIDNPKKLDKDFGDPYYDQLITTLQFLQN
jgi:hypothetical protein